MWSEVVAALQRLILMGTERYGLLPLVSVFLVTSGIRALLLPVTLPLSTRSRGWRDAHKRIKAPLKEARQRLKGDPIGLNEEVARLHESVGIPLVDKAGLGLALVQLPVLIALFQAVMALPLATAAWPVRAGLSLGASVLALASAYGAGEPPGKIGRVLYFGLPLIFGLWLGEGIAVYMMALYAVTWLQGALGRRAG